MTVRLALSCLVLVAAGCAQQPLQPELPEPPPTVQPALEPPVPAEIEPEPAPEPEPPAVVEAAPVDAPERPVDGIAIVLSDRTPAFESVAAELGRLLDDYLLYNLADKSLGPPEVFAGIADARARVVIAIGLAATREAVLRSPVPVVFCQVFNIAASLDSKVPVRGVTSTPPLAEQVAAWKQLNPRLQTIGAILGPGHEALIAEARNAAAAHDVVFRHRIVSSDRETLFTFQRMAPGIDGFWLFPDNRVLSVDILEELLDYAARHDVDMAVFNEALLGMGATLSVTTVDADIAATTLAVAGRVLEGDVDRVPFMTALNDVRIVTRKGPLTARKGDEGGEP